MSKRNKGYPKRYYAQYTKPYHTFHAAWHVFDRDRTSKQGDVEPICECVSRKVAFAIRNALNKAEEANGKR